MRHILILMISFMCTCCAYDGHEDIFLDPCVCVEDPRKLFGIDKDFIEFVETFEMLAEQEVTDLPIHYGKESEFKVNKDGSHTIGFCRGWRNVLNGTLYKEVRIKRSWWEQASYDSREFLILHELGHCFLDREHNENFIEMNGEIIPESIMYPLEFGWQYYYGYYKEYYFEELVNAR